MYDIVFDTIRIFDDNCDDTTSGDTILARQARADATNAVKAASINVVSTQKYSLFPNPNNGTFTLQQLVADKEPIQVEIWDAVGRSIYKSKLRFAEGKAGMKIMNSIPGSYLLLVTDHKGKQYRFKFVVE